MILTGRAKEDFLKWNYDNDFGYIDHEPTSLVVHFEDLDDNLRNTIIIEWFDSVGVYINIAPSIAIGYENVDFFYFTINNESNRLKFNSRQEATKQAILKANQIYNESKN